MEQTYFPCTFEVWDAEHENLITTGEGEIFYRTEVETVKITKHRPNKYTRMIHDLFGIDVVDDAEEIEVASYLLYPGRATPNVRLRVQAGGRLETFFANSLDAMFSHNVFSPIMYRRKIIARTPHEVVTVEDTFPQSIEPLGDLVVVDISGHFTLSPL